MRPLALRPLLHCRRPAIYSLPSIRTPTPFTPRTYAVQAPGAPTLQVFNSHVKYLQKERAASNPEQSRQVDYLRDEIATRLADRLLDINRDFPHILDLGANACNLSRALTTPLSDTEPPASSRITHLTCAETSPTLLHRDDALPLPSPLEITRTVLPTLESLPYEADTFDAVISSLALHWVNDLPALLAHANRALKPDAPILAAMFGGDTLFELRTALQLASQERRGGVAPHTSPLADVRDIGGLLTKAGFKLLTVDVEDVVVEFPDMFALMADLQAMGESNAVLGREMGGIGREVLAAASAIYKELYGEEGKEGIPATFRVIFFIGWKESPDQRKPLPRGSGEVNMKDILGGGSIN
ncbi:hypothetical protein V498_07740 [Pseudogymnoascus sp. VKM F-4517 (FW-2822)]|nr:hypothetical protein V498_07740 [Pseudogymnoascus sp. VKM F-4517 (FW-2822)]